MPLPPRSLSRAQKKARRKIMILKELSFSFRWDNLEAIVEWLHALPDRGTIFAAIETSMLKEAALEAFQSVFSEMPLTQSTLEHSGFGTPFYGLSVMYFSIAHPVDTPFHPPITRLMKLHPEGSGICLCSLLRRCGSAWASSRNLIWMRCAASTKPKRSFWFKYS